MNGRDHSGASAIWTSWSLDRLFIVDELINTKKKQLELQRHQKQKQDKK